MKLGVSMFATDYAIRPDELARACEQRGFESVWFPEHTHIPASRRSPWPGGAELPQEYWHTHDLFVSLAAAAAVTQTIKIGSGICLVIEHDPIVLAKEVASVDQLSNGRLLFGIGGGWNAEEMENHGTPFNRRWKVLRERIEAMKVIWSEEAAEYHGEFVNFDPIWCYPKPAQKPHPPILLGTLSAQGLNRVVRYCDGWIPVGLMLKDLPAAVRDLRAQAEQAGRKPSEVPVSIFGAAATEATLQQYQELGVERTVFGLPPAGRDKVLPLLDQYSVLIPKFA
ncbi:MAG TPA: LLM class F420-dependent oxidoreductase [Candidatus Binatia bacterium]|nr:LLM class F420-dependent oxidoreductase [Candidatus Binatia bacterium]